MMSYKDMTFCEFYKNCEDGKSCHRALTPKVRQNAVDWWGSQEAPIAKFMKKPNCYKDIFNPEDE